MGRSTHRRILILIGLLLLAAGAYGADRYLHIQGVAAHVESDQTRRYHIPGGVAFIETQAAVAGTRRVMVVGP